MKGKSVGLQILLWSEVIVSARVLLFSIPVIINKCLAQSFSLSSSDDRFIAVMTLTALLYFLVGIVSIAGYRFWKAIHYAAAILIILLTVCSLNMSGQTPAAPGLYYFSPLLFSVIVTVLAGILRGAKRAA